MRKKSKKEWWEIFFDKRYFKTQGSELILPEATRKQISFLIENLKLKKGSSILDLACGYGRHSIGLAEAGYKVTGLDFSSYFLILAKKEAKKRHTNIRFIKEDMRKIDFENEFDAVISMFTSLGYFQNEKDNLAVFKNVARALKPNGKFFIDLANPAWLIKHMIDKDSGRKKIRLATKGRMKPLRTGIEVFLQEEFDPLKMRWYVIRRWKEGRKLYKNYVSDIRIYSLPELKHLLEENNLKIQKIWGDFNGSPFTAKSPRMLIFAQKI